MQLSGKIISRFLMIIIRSYQHVISPWISPSCRFSPTCSEYALKAIEKYGSLKGGWMAVRRIAACHPWGRHGHDPVP
ncbi:MAG: membrane protein insertion efficiency factor YidD [Chitinophagales bacterium]|nr:membrane protein insertion efficiency factor YidD [Chitinophagales bacterium]